MTFTEFKSKSQKLANEKFEGEINSPIEFSLRRAEFVEQKLKKLIALAEQSPHRTALRKKEGWQRQLARVQDNRQRMANSYFPPDGKAARRSPTL